MTHPEGSSPHPPADPLRKAVSERVQDLLQSGAVLTQPAFSIANPDQGDVIYATRRWLVAPNDARYQRYAQIMNEAALPYITGDPTLSTGQVMVGEIPRDSRGISQIIRSRQPETGMNVRDVLFLLGQTLGYLATERQVMPDPKAFSLKNVLILRRTGMVMLVPPLSFDAPTPDNKAALVDNVRNELLSKYARFGGPVLLNEFQRGLE